MAEVLPVWLRWIYFILFPKYFISYINNTKGGIYLNPMDLTVRINGHSFAVQFLEDLHLIPDGTMIEVINPSGHDARFKIINKQPA